MAPVQGFVEAAQIIAFLFVIGGSFKVLERTGAVTVSIQSLAATFARKPHLQRYFIPVTMLVFSIGGAVFGMCEETMPFVLVFIPLALSLGYDSLVGTAIPFLGAAAGFAGSVFNPFTVGIAQGIAELPLYSGMEYRMVIWLISTVCMISVRDAACVAGAPEPRIEPRLRARPGAAPRWHGRGIRGKRDPHPAAPDPPRGRGRDHRTAGVRDSASTSGIFHEIAGLFFGLGLLAGPVGGLSLSESSDAFKEGARDMVGVALIIGCARAILVIATDGKILDLMLYGIASVIRDFHPIVASQAMFVAQGIINFFVHSGSGQAALTMPVMAPLADVVGISRQTAVLAFQFGEGWINPILPTSGVTMGVLGLAGISWEKWFRWMLPAQIFFFILALLLMIPPYLFNYH